MIDLLQYIPGKHKKTASGWISFNAPCCIHNGESADRRQRGGILMQPDGSWSYHCFNCEFKASFVMGRSLSYRARRFLNWLNVPTSDIEWINLESLKHKNIEGLLIDRQQQAPAPSRVSFEEKTLKEAGTEVITKELHPELWRYLQSRSVPNHYPVLKAESTRAGVVVPFTYNNMIVGHATRFLDDRRPKYIHDTQPGYVFGTDLQYASWQHAIVVEGVFDALAISGLAVLHADINDDQARLLRELGREITVVPDQDSAGMRLIDRAVELGWAVSLPEWDDCKDVNDAVIKYGRVPTLLSIMQARETSRIKIELRKKQIAKRL